MTTASPTRHQRRAGFVSMESLGFLEAPYDSSHQSVQRHRIGGAHLAPSTIPLLPEPSTGGRHVREMDVEEDLLTTTLIDWAPQEASTRLRKRDFRWTTITLIVVVLAGLGVGGYWLYQRPAEVASQAIATVEDDATALAGALDDTKVIAEQLATGQTVADYSEILNETEAEARDLFAASADLEQDDVARAAVADEASAVLDYTGRLNAAIAFRAALEPALVLPDFESESESIDLATAASEFGAWRAYLDEIADALPEDVDAGLISAFDDLRIALGSAQTSYLDSLREEDDAAVGFILRRVEGDLDDLGSQIQQSFASLSTELLTEIDATQQELLRLFG